MRTSLRRWTGVLAVPTVIAATVASDFVGLPGFWREHAITAGLVSGLALLVIGLLAVDGYVEGQDSRRWQTAARVGFKGLARANEEALDDLAFAFTGRKPPYATYAPPWPEDWSRRLAEHELKGDLGVEAIGAILADPARVVVVEEALVALRLRHRDRIGFWLPTFVAVRRLAETAEKLACFNEVLGDVQGPVADARRRHTGSFDAGDPDESARCLDALCRALKEGLHLQHSLMHDAGATWFVVAERHTTLLGGVIEIGTKLPVTPTGPRRVEAIMLEPWRRLRGRG